MRKSDKGESVGRKVYTLLAKLHSTTLWIMWVVGGTSLVLLTLFTISHIVARSIFNAPIKGVVEIIELETAVIFFTAIAYTTFKGGHVLVDLLVSHFPKGAQRIIISTMTLVGAGAFAALAWQLGLSAQDAALGGNVTTNLRIPIFPFRFLASVGAGIACIEFLISFGRSLSNK